jgi:hypothetical protein
MKTVAGLSMRATALVAVDTSCSVDDHRNGLV